MRCDRFGSHGGGSSKPPAPALPGDDSCWSQFHCNTQSTDKIALMREVAICTYVMVIHTPRLCAEPFFLGSGASGAATEPSHVVSCQPIAKQPSALGATDARTTPGYEPEPLSSVLPPPIDDAEALLPDQADPAFEEPEVDTLASSREQGRPMFILDLGTGKISLQEPLKEDQPSEEGSIESEYANEALTSFAAVVERTLAAAIERGPPDQNKDRAPSKEALERIGHLLKSMNSAVAYKQSQKSNGEVGNEHHQAMKGVYEEQFDGENQGEKQKVAPVRDEL